MLQRNIPILKNLKCGGGKTWKILDEKMAKKERGRDPENMGRQRRKKKYLSHGKTVSNVYEFNVFYSKLACGGKLNTISSVNILL